MYVRLRLRSFTLKVSLIFVYVYMRLRKRPFTPAFVYAYVRQHIFARACSVSSDLSLSVPVRTFLKKRARHRAPCSNFVKTNTYFKRSRVFYVLHEFEPLKAGPSSPYAT